MWSYISTGYRAYTGVAFSQQQTEEERSHQSYHALCHDVLSWITSWG